MASKKSEMEQELVEKELSSLLEMTFRMEDEVNSFARTEED